MQGTQRKTHRLSSLMHNDPIISTLHQTIKATTEGLLPKLPTSNQHITTQQHTSPHKADTVQIYIQTPPRLTKTSREQNLTPPKGIVA
jgi:hypothetical protein